MKILYFLIVLFHGLIHLLGFVKGFGLKEIKELTQPISKPMGLLWLFSFLLLLLYGLLQFSNNRYLWLFGCIAAVMSQILIFVYWKDAKFGTIPNVLIFLVSMVGLGSFLLKNEFSHRVKEDFFHNNQKDTNTLTQNDIKHLPAIVQKYLYYTKSVGQPKVKNFRAEFTGGMRLNPKILIWNCVLCNTIFIKNHRVTFLWKLKKWGFLPQVFTSIKTKKQPLKSEC
ncbi:MAG: hypothetical protein IPN79_17455 [Saprospiraceae bacterium]|nr:hypothetical protein [Saprospiraceae bacterium]